MASEVYELIPAAAAAAAVMLAGALATALAIRWGAHAIAALGLIGGLGSPILLGAPTSGAALIAMLAIGAACAMAVVGSAWKGPRACCGSLLSLSPTLPWARVPGHICPSTPRCVGCWS